MRTTKEFLEERISEDEAWAKTLDARMAEYVFGECAAKRAILQEHVEIIWNEVWDIFETTCRLCGGDRRPYPCATVYALLCTYATHPEWDEFEAVLGGDRG